MSDADEKFLWQMIELAWMRAEGTDAGLRQTLLTGFVGDYEVAMRPFNTALLHVLMKTVTRDGLSRFAQEFERRLFALDREKLAEHIELGDDGFLDARRLIVAMGEEHYRAVIDDVRAARPRAAAERVYQTLSLAWELRFAEPYPRLDIPVTTGSNLAAWPSKAARKAREDERARERRAMSEALRVAQRDADVSRWLPGPTLKHENNGDVTVRLEALVPEEVAELGALLRDWQLKRHERHDERVRAEGSGGGSE
jgi:hypothetical protein